MAKQIDLTGKRFGKLYVIGRDGYLNNQKAWLCRCDCGNEVRVRSFDLRNCTRSCGCLRYEIDRIQTEYRIDGDTAICYARDGTEFYVDSEDVNRIKDKPWYVSPRGYLVTSILSENKNLTFLHRYIMGEIEGGKEIDHKDGNKLNNRKNNLRICTRQENIWNIKNRPTNKYGFTGVDIHNGKWRARISYNNRLMDVGYYKTYKDAVMARYNAEQKYFGEYAPHTWQDVEDAIRNHNQEGPGA